MCITNLLSGLTSSTTLPGLRFDRPGRGLRPSAFGGADSSRWVHHANVALGSLGRIGSVPWVGLSGGWLKSGRFRRFALPKHVIDMLLLSEE